MSAEKYLQQFYITAEDCRNVRALWQDIKGDAAWIFDEFYAWLPSVGGLGERFRDPNLVRSNRKLVEAHWGQFFSAHIDQAYIDSRKKIGQRHAFEGLPLHAYYSGVAKLDSLFEELFLRLGVNDVKKIISFNKQHRMDIAIVADTYSSLTQKSLQDRNEALYAPIAQLWDDILFVPLVGEMSHERAQNLLSAILQAIGNKQSKVFILDISGVLVIDEGVSQQLIRISKAANLMGCQCIVSGVSPQNAVTIVELGFSTQDLQTTASLKEAIRLGFKQTAVRL
ncbi:anti-anti-sigma regulatory factor (antagonist of anti-sigma factor) [Saprospira grandis DSM 2844]|uniref:Anti-anti-sigma regulatory factor (Antagonist of anti-sigma factor) n=1 Tax=Saprospira grandis DSM 2844 TaxID=694433 RepID=J1I1B4_9BACT|nr:protoglobin domain-containing protein [Saprospira grandis]EJF52058.1 anti-anti-sigma regulatory factor (antagonist of anti-sigma factor) [Saprospira grandis DSM 2844]